MSRHIETKCRKCGEDHHEGSCLRVTHGGSFAPPLDSASDIDAVLDEHREMCFLLMQSVDAMRVTQRLFGLSDGHMLISKCREIERWLDSHQSPNAPDQRPAD